MEDVKKLDLKVREALNSNPLYYEMMEQWHDLKGGLAVEPEVKSFIETACKPGAWVLEAGSGSGSITNWFATRHKETQFIGIDISRIGVEIAHKKAPTNASFQVGDLKLLPFKDRSFHFAFAQSVLEHVVGWDDAVADVYRVLLPNGKLLIRLENGGVQNVSRYRALLNYLMGRNRDEIESPSFELKSGSRTDHEHNFDVNRIPSDLLVNALQRVGFRVSYFTTGTGRWRSSKNLGARVLSFLDFWPFNHLGDITIVLATKPR